MVSAILGFQEGGTWGQWGQTGLWRKAQAVLGLTGSRSYTGQGSQHLESIVDQQMPHPT